jgi:hypothetical protein
MFCQSFFFMKSILLILLSCFGTFNFAQNSAHQSFKAELEKHCGKSYEGEIIAGGIEGDGFVGERLVMQVLSCEKDQIKVPFYVGKDKSRTWILSFQENSVQLKHDHRHEDGTPDEVTLYGGTSTNSGHSTLQMFPADQETCSMIDYACHNVWWMTIDENSFTYNLRRIGSDRLFTVKFDLSKLVEFKETPWGWKN